MEDLEATLSDAQNGDGPGDQTQPDASAEHEQQPNCTPATATSAADSASDASDRVATPAGTIWVTCFKTYNQKVGKRFKGTFEQWCDYLERAPLAKSDQVKDRLPGFCPAIFRGDRKENQEVEGVDLLVTEYDNEEWITSDEIDPNSGKPRRVKLPIPPDRRTTPEAALALWEGYSCAIYTSWSHTPDLPKFRVLISLSRRVSPEEHERVWRWMHARAAEAGHVIDIATKNPSRMWFLPCRRDGSEFRFLRAAGKALDVDAILSDVPAAPVENNPKLDRSTRLGAFVDRVKAGIDMQHLVESDGLRLGPHGSTKVAFSPFRDDGKKPSFVVYPDHCFDFVTSEHYDALRYWQERHSLSFWDALDALADKLGLDRFVRGDAHKPVPVDPQSQVDEFVALDPVPSGDERTRMLRPICAMIGTQDEVNWSTWTKPLARKCGVSVGVINRLVRESIKGSNSVDAAPVSADSAYPVVEGRLCVVRRAEGGRTVNEPLSNFDAWVSEVVTIDDGAERTKKFMIAGKLASGGDLRPIEVAAEKYDAMEWVTPGWNGRAIIAPGRGMRDTLRAAILSKSNPVESLVYGDLGWHSVGGKRVYLHAGGAIGSDCVVRVQTRGELTQFELPPDARDRDALKAAVGRSMMFLSVAPPEVAYPMYCTVWTAPLLEFIPFEAVVAVIGKTQAMKSSLALEVQKHSGPFRRVKDLPLNFEASPTAIELVLHAAKDCLVVMDDYFPRRNAKDAEKQKGLADRVARSIGNGSSRKRANANVQLRASRPPRGIVLMTCEEDPCPVAEGESASARTLKVFLERGAVDKKVLSSIQTRGDHALVMRHYIESIARIEDIGIVATSQSAVRERLRGHAMSDRMPDVIASMLTGFELFLRTVAGRFYREEEWRHHLSKAEEVLVNLAMNQNQSARSQEPDLRYLETVKDALNSGRARLAPTCRALDPTPSCREIGWYDDQHVYLHPRETHILVTEIMRSGGEFNPWRLETIYDQLVHRGYASPRNDGNHLGTKRGPLGGARVRVIELARGLFSDVRIESPTRIPQEDITAAELETIMNAQQLAN